MKHDPLILVIDSQSVYEQMAPVLSRELHTTHVWHKETLEEALEIIKGDTWLDLIFADWGRTGTTLVDAIRSDEENHSTPLVVMTSVDSTDKVNTAVKHGASAILTKPFLEKALVNVVRKIVNSEDRRHNRRLHPDKQVDLEVTTGNGRVLNLRLNDISLTGIQFITPLPTKDQVCQQETISLNKHLCIGDSGLLKIKVDRFDLEMDGILCRLEMDGLNHKVPHLLATYRFTETHEVRVNKLEALLNEYAARW